MRKVERRKARPRQLSGRRHNGQVSLLFYHLRPLPVAPNLDKSHYCIIIHTHCGPVRSHSAVQFSLASDANEDNPRVASGQYIKVAT